MKKHPILSTLLVVFCLGKAVGQQPRKEKADAATITDNRQLTIKDTVPMRHDARFQGGRKETASQKINNAPVDSVVSLEKYIQRKADCEVTKFMDDDGSILIRYPDGYTKKSVKGVIVEVITPDGVRHVPKWTYIPQIKVAVIQVPPPVPGVNDPIYKWLANFRADLETNIREAIGGGDARWNLFLSDENDACGNNIYKQIQFRTDFLENYGKAK